MHLNWVRRPSLFLSSSESSATATFHAKKKRRNMMKFPQICSMQPSSTLEFEPPPIPKFPGQQPGKRTQIIKTSHTALSLPMAGRVSSSVLLKSKVTCPKLCKTRLPVHGLNHRNNQSQNKRNRPMPSKTKPTKHQTEPEQVPTIRFK